MTNNERRNWVKTRFGEIAQETLGNLADLQEMVWPDVEMVFTINDNELRYGRIKDIEALAPRIAEIYQLGIDELIGNDVYEWHHDPEAIVENVKGGDWMFYGCYHGDELIGIESIHAIRGQRTMQCVWGCVDPAHRTKGVWARLGPFNDEIVRQSGAHLGIAWAATTHDLTQRAMEAMGYAPMGCFIGTELLGGSDGHYYRQNVIWYGKFYGDAGRHRQRWDQMKLTPAAAKVMGVVRGLWDKKEGE